MCKVLNKIASICITDTVSRSQICVQMFEITCGVQKVVVICDLLVTNLNLLAAIRLESLTGLDKYKYLIESLLFIQLQA